MRKAIERVLFQLLLGIQTMRNHGILILSKMEFEIIKLSQFVSGKRVYHKKQTKKKKKGTVACIIHNNNVQHCSYHFLLLSREQHCAQLAVSQVTPVIECVGARIAQLVVYSACCPA